MKIAVYGDSFASGIKGAELPTTSWTYILGKKLNSAIHSYGEPGSSVYYSFKQFLETYEEYDLAIFLVSDPSRFPVKCELSNGVTFHATGMPVLDYIKSYQSKLDSVDKINLDNLEGWFKASDGQYMVDMTDLMLSKMETLCDNIIILPCFEGSFTLERMNKEKNIVPMNNLFVRQCELLNITPDKGISLFFNENPTVMFAHLGPEFNEFVADVIYDRITTGKWDFSEYKNVKLQHKQDYYYKVD